MNGPKHDISRGGAKTIREYQLCAHKHGPEDASAHLQGNVVSLLPGAIKVRTMRAQNGRKVAEVRVVVVSWLVEAKRPQYGEALSKVEATLTPAERVAAGETEKVACSSIMHTEGLAFQVARSSGFCADLLTSLHESHVIGKDGILALGFEMESRLARERRDQGSNHGRQEGEKRPVVVVLPPLPSLTEARLMREGAQRMDVGEEVVDQQV